MLPHERGHDLVALGDAAAHLRGKRVIHLAQRALPAHHLRSASPEIFSARSCRCSAFSCRPIAPSFGITIDPANAPGFTNEGLLHVTGTGKATITTGDFTNSGQVLIDAGRVLTAVASTRRAPTAP